MNKSKTIYFLSAFVLIIGCYALNLSYSLFIDTQEKSIINASVPELSYILENNVYTVAANSAEAAKIKISNTGPLNMHYGVSTNLSDDVIVQLVDKIDNEIIDNSIIGTLNSESTDEVWLYITNNTSNAVTITFNLTVQHTTVNLSSYLNESFVNSSGIDVENKVNLQLLSSIIKENAKNVTNEGIALGYAEYSKESKTTVAETPSGSDESTLSETADDYTALTGNNSYYFRGNVKNNYVNFAGMCWRIVRIAGDGSTKLILEDQYTTCDDSETEITTDIYTGNWNIGTGNYGYDSSSKSTSGTKLYKMNYLNPVTSNTSSMVKAFYDFQTSKLADYTGKLKSGDWCLGDIAYTESGSVGSYTYTLLEDTSSNYLSETSFYYDAYTRLTSGNANGYQPTLKCNGTILNEFEDVTGVSGKAPMYVSTMTADETVYAGGIWFASNENFYLINDYQKSNRSKFWLLSPSNFWGNADLAFSLGRDFGMNGEYVAEDRIAFRPSISLMNDVVYISGNGSQKAPYVIS